MLRINDILTLIHRRSVFGYIKQLLLAVCSVIFTDYRLLLDNGFCYRHY